MTNQIEDLGGKTPEELDQLAHEGQARLDKLLRTREPDFGLGGPELAPVTDDEVKAAIDELEKAIKIRNLAYLQARQREVLEGIRRRTASEKADATRISLYGLREEVRPRERRGPARTEQRPPHLRRQPRRQMFAVNLPCVVCGTNVPELPFEPNPCQAIYCQQHWLERRGQEGQTGTVGAAFQDALREKDERTQELEAENATLRAGGSVASPKLSKKERKRRAQLKRGEREDE